MKILQTIGKHGGHQAGIFQYKRDSQGIVIDLAIGQANLQPNLIRFSNQEWSQILGAIHNSRQRTFRLTPARRNAGPPNQDLYSLIAQAVPNPADPNWIAWHGSFQAAVCAILEHEGSIDLYHGRLGRGANIPICLSKDI
jgi:hypothetical protein